MEKWIALNVKARNGSIILITITITHPCNHFSIAIISSCDRRDYDYTTLPKSKNNFVQQ